MSLQSQPFERYLARDSAVHRLDPRVKLIVAVAFIIGVALLPDGAWLLYGIAFALVMGATITARLSPLLVIKRSLVGLPFLLAAISILFTLPGNVLWSGPMGLSISDAGLTRFASIVLRSLISLQAAVLLTATTPFPDLLHAMRHLKVPNLFFAIIAFMYRYLFVLTDEAARLLRGRAARSASLPGYKAGGSLSWRAGTAGSMVGQLFVRSLDRSERVYQAMQARGYRGQMMTMHPHVMSRGDWAALVAGCMAAVVLALAGRMLY